MNAPVANFVRIIFECTCGGFKGHRVNRSTRISAEDLGGAAEALAHVVGGLAHVVGGLVIFI